jgi:hypothetical protein
MAKLADIHIGQILGKGFKGTVYLATNNKGNKYALKAEQIRKIDAEKSLKSFVWRELYFAKNMADKYPNQFMKIYDYQIDKNGIYKHDHKNVKGADNISNADKKYYSQLFASPYSFITLTSLVDGIFGQVNWPTAIFYNLFIQNVYIAYLINKEGYMHADLHQNNIGFVKTSDKTINILGYNIPTHGYYLQAIDYGSILSKKFDLKSTEIKRMETDNDLSPPINNFLIKFDTLIKTYKELKSINIDDILYNNYQIDKNDLNECIKFIPNYESLDKISKKFLSISIYKILFYDKFEKYLLGDKLTKPIAPDLLLPKNIIIYIIGHFLDVKKILEYLIKNRNN